MPADARLVAAAGLAVDESTLTGESVPVDKAIERVDEETPLSERSSMVYAGSAVTSGRGRALVTATGAATEFGQIAGLTEQARPPPTPLQRRVGALTRLMVAFGVEYDVEAGDPADAIVALAVRHKADLIVVGTHERGFLDRLFHGSVSEGVSRHAHCDVLVVR